MKSHSDVNMKNRKPRQADLHLSQYPQVKKVYNFARSAKKNLSNQSNIYYNDQPGGFSYDDFYDSLRELNAEKNDRSIPIAPKSGTVTAYSSPKASQKSFKHEKPPLNPIMTKNISPVKTKKERKIIPGHNLQREVESALTPGFNTVMGKNRSSPVSQSIKSPNSLNQTVLKGLMIKSFSKPKDKIHVVQRDDIRKRAKNSDKFKINPFKSSLSKPREAKVEPREEKKCNIKNTPTLSFQNKTVLNPDITLDKNKSEKNKPEKKKDIGPDKAFRLAQKIFARKVVRKDQTKKRMDTKKLADFKQCIINCKKKYSSAAITPVKKRGFRHKKYTEAYLQNCLTHLKVIKALCVALETNKHKTFGPL